MALAFFCVITLVVVIVASILSKRQQPVPDDESMNIDFNLCPLCDQPTGFIVKPPTIRDDY
jgi:hypothetical protein